MTLAWTLPNPEQAPQGLNNDHFSHYWVYHCLEVLWARSAICSIFLHRHHIPALTPSLSSWLVLVPSNSWPLSWPAWALVLLQVGVQIFFPSKQGISPFISMLFSIFSFLLTFKCVQFCHLKHFLCGAGDWTQGPSTCWESVRSMNHSPSLLSILSHPLPPNLLPAVFWKCQLVSGHNAEPLLCFPSHCSF